MRFDFDLIVIGGGAAGLTGSGMAALLGARTALVEEHRLGGDCTWTGCVPSKSLIQSARVAEAVRRSGQFGVEAGRPEVDFAKVMARLRAIRERIYQEADAPGHFERMGAHVIPAKARFLDDHTVEVTGAEGRKRLTARFFLIATGSRPKTPDFGVPCLTNETLFELDRQPGRLLILGGGPVGIEMSQAFCRLGSRVTVVAQGPAILPHDDPELTGMLRERLGEEGVSFRMRSRVESVERLAGGLLARLGTGEVIECDAVFAAIGRAPNLESLDLGNAGVAFDTQGIHVDRHCRTSRHHIYASGDVTGRHLFTHMAEHTSKVAVENAILRIPRKVNAKRVSWCTFTEPELAQAGQTEAELRKEAVRYQTFRFPFSKLDRAITDSETLGMVKVLASPRGKILGASILGAHAGEMIAEYALALQAGLSLGKISATIHPYPTYALGNRLAADRRAVLALDSPLLPWLGRVLGYRGERRGSGALS